MTHEFVQLLNAYKASEQQGLQSVLATIVHVEGSSYRKEGTQMLINERQQLTCALSGGCVEKEVVRQAQSVFATGCPKVFKYDGRFRLGCEGSIYILIERFEPSEKMVDALENAIQQRKAFTVKCYFEINETSSYDFGTTFVLSTDIFEHANFRPTADLVTYCMTMKPLNRLCIFGIEHDAEKLSRLAHFLGWEVIIIGSEQSNVSASDFPFANEIITQRPEELPSDLFGEPTAVIAMSHSYAKDLQFLKTLLDKDVSYIGLLGPIHRRERILNDLLEHNVFIEESFFEKIHGPVGIDIGSETPEEIALSIMAEVVAAFKQVPHKQLAESN